MNCIYVCIYDVELMEIQVGIKLRRKVGGNIIEVEKKEVAIYVYMNSLFQVNVSGYKPQASFHLNAHLNQFSILDVTNFLFIVFGIFLLSSYGIDLFLVFVYT